MGKFAQTKLFAIRHLSIGCVAPEIDGEDIHGKPMKLSDHRGKIVMLSFWGHWGGPCRELYPHERSLVKRLSGKPFVLLGVNSDKNRQAIKQTLVDENITWRSWWDEGRIDGPIHTTWQILARPSIHILDAKGVIRYTDIQPEAVEKAIYGLLSEKSPGCRPYCPGDFSLCHGICHISIVWSALALPVDAPRGRCGRS